MSSFINTDINDFIENSYHPRTIDLVTTPGFVHSKLDNLIESGYIIKDNNYLYDSDYNLIGNGRTYDKKLFKDAINKYEMDRKLVDGSGRSVDNDDIYTTKKYMDKKELIDKGDLNSWVIDIIKYALDNDLTYFEEKNTYTEGGIKYDIKLFKSHSGDDIQLIFRDSNENKHREYDPAVIWFSSDKKLKPGTIILEKYYKDNELHRTDGPAYINHVTGTKSYYLNDKKYGYLKYQYKCLFIKEEKSEKNLVETVDTIKNEQEQLKLKIQRERETALTESSNKIKKLKSSIEQLDNYLLNSIYEQTVEIHNKFKDDEKLNIKYLNQMHKYYTDTLFDLLEKISFNIEHNEKSLKTKLERKKIHLDHLQKEYSNISNVNNVDITKYVNELEIQLSALYNKKLNYNDFRLLPAESVFNIDYYKDIKELNFYKENDITVKTDNYFYYEGWTISEKLLEILHKNRYVISYIGAVINEELDISSVIEIYKVDGVLFGLSNNTFDIIETFDDTILNDNNCWKFNLTNKINIYEKEIKKLEHDFSNIKLQIFSTKLEKTFDDYIEKLSNFNLNEDDVNLDTQLSEKMLNEILNLEMLNI